ncbi:MAG TPA: alpha/beta hydrolase, partial [Bacteroidetes bacterium]|nr:alpha/beta hydrolase [Bacteroidota bacterium]
GTYPKRGNYSFIKEKTEYTFHDPNTATKELVDEVYEIVNSRDKAIRVIALSRSAMRNNLSKELHKIKVPVCLIWGNEDNITPAFVAKDFHELLPNSELNYIKECGHAAMMEKPHEFNVILKGFLNKLTNAG